MKKDNETTVEQLLNCLRKEDDANMIPFHCEWIEAAYKRKMLENRFKLDNNKDEINGLRALIKELADAVSENMTAQCEHCDLRQACQEGEDGIVVPCNQVIKLREALEKAWEVVSGATQPTTSGRSNQESVPSPKFLLCDKNIGNSQC